MKRTHIIIQTGYIDFFNSLTWKSAAMFERANTDDDYFVIGFVPEMRQVADELERTNHKVKYVDVSDFAQLTIAEVMKKLDFSMTSANMQYVATVNIFNGACNSYQSAELETFTAYCKTFSDKSVKRDLPLIDAAGSVYKALMYVVYDIFAVIVQYNMSYNAHKPANEHIGTVINNFVEDPLQHKLNYLDYRYTGPYESMFSKSCALKVMHWYFHDCAVPTRIISKDIVSSMYTFNVTPEQTDSATYNWCPSQQYWYLHGKSYADITQLKQEKKHTFAFALTNTWKDRSERTVIINKLMHLHNAKAVNDGFVFRFYSRHKTQQHLSDKLLPYDTYLELIKYSKFTLIVPSYDVDCFSLRRFCESLVLGCIPLIYEKCNLHMFNRWPAFKSILEQYCIVTDDNLQNLQEFIAALDYDKLLHKIWHTEFIQQYVTNYIYDVALYNAHINKTVVLDKTCNTCAYYKVPSLLHTSRCSVCAANSFMLHKWSCQFCQHYNASTDKCPFKYSVSPYSTSIDATRSICIDASNFTPAHQYEIVVQ